MGDLHRAEGLRDASAALCAEFTRAEAECFKDWCRLLDGRAGPRPDDVVESQAALHEAATRLRAWCQADPAAAEAERWYLMARQAQGEIDAEAAVRARKTAAALDAVRRAWVNERWAIICQRDALTCGLGWPHRGERVTVSTLTKDATGAPVPVAGDGIYLNSSDVFNAGHSVWLPALGRRRRGELRVTWALPGAEDGPLGPPDPAGSIGMRLADAPGCGLPVPLVRWPGPADAGIDVPPAAAPASQDAMFTAPPAVHPSRSARRAGRAKRDQTGAAPGQATLF